MEEKKLTDEEIIRTLDYMARECPANFSASVLSLIHRLQSEKDKPKSKKILANRVYSDATLKSWKKEDLIEEIRILEHNWAAAEEALNNSAKNSDKIFAEQNAEIERLTEQFDEKVLREIVAQNCILNEKNAELQKQADEYKAKIEQGTLVELPVKLTEKCYVIFGRHEKYIKEVCVIMYEIGTVDKWARVIWYEGERKLWEDFHVNELYPTREEAEKRLKELQE